VGRLFHGGVQNIFHRSNYFSPSSTAIPRWGGYPTVGFNGYPTVGDGYPTVGCGKSWLKMAKSGEKMAKITRFSGQILSDRTQSLERLDLFLA